MDKLEKLLVSLMVILVVSVVGLNLTNKAQKDNLIKEAIAEAQRQFKYEIDAIGEKYVSCGVFTGQAIQDEFNGGHVNSCQPNPEAKGCPCDFMNKKVSGR